MAKQTREAEEIQKRPSIFWKPTKIGETVVGKFVSWQETQYGLAMKLKKSDGTHAMVGMSAVLFNLFAGHHNIKDGAVVEIHFEGKAKRALIYSATVDKKELESASSFAPAGKEAVDAYFKAGYKFEKGKRKGAKK